MPRETAGLCASLFPYLWILKNLLYIRVCLPYASRPLSLPLSLPPFLRSSFPPVFILWKCE